VFLCIHIASNLFGLSRHGNYVNTQKHSLDRLKRIRFKYLSGPGMGAIVDLNLVPIRGR
jgi:hypothetical protein